MHLVSITTLECLGGPYDGRAIDVNDRVLGGDVPIEIVALSKGASGSARLGEYRVRPAQGSDTLRILAWLPAQQS